MKFLRLSEKDRTIFKKLNFRAPSLWLAIWFGCGFMRPAPGTWGTVGALPPAILIGVFASPPVFAAAILILCAAGYWASAKFEEMSGEHDSKMIVIDEAAGQWIALWPVLTVAVINPWLIVLSFLLFRFFDIVKPWPVSIFDRKVKGAAGVMGDDIVAGLISALILTGLQYAGFG